MQMIDINVDINGNTEHTLTEHTLTERTLTKHTFATPAGGQPIKDDGVMCIVCFRYLRRVNLPTSPFDSSMIGNHRYFVDGRIDDSPNVVVALFCDTCDRKFIRGEFNFDHPPRRAYYSLGVIEFIRSQKLLPCKKEKCRLCTS